MAFSAMISDISCLFSLALEFSTRFRGASPKLHAVRDFYSHSDWIHNDFNKNDVKMAKLVFAFDTVSVLFISWTTTSCEEPASRLTSSIASLQIAQPANHLYRNNRDGTFTDVTAKANLVRSGWGQGVCVGDYNNDGVMDLFVTYYGKNVLYRNNGDGTFTPATLLTMFARCSAAERTRLRTCSGRRLRRGRPRTRPRDCVVNELCW